MAKQRSGFPRLRVALVVLLCVGIKAQAAVQDERNREGKPTSDIGTVDALREKLLDGEALAQNDAEELLLILV